uniref:Uncharacterized protein n=1 Tax=Timema monikensis TaxID=170555 RepID=A0A7R9HV94_9NEOP|nr:unnamed protein product [Timema monikensis]
MNLIDLLIFFLLVLLSSRLFKELLRVVRNYIIGHKHVGVGNPQAHNNRPATGPSLENTPTLRVEAPRIQRAQKVTPLRPDDQPNCDPYVPADAPAEKQFFQKVDPRRVFELEAGDPYVPAYKLFFKKSEH